jgi:hypothetical protein
MPRHLAAILLSLIAVSGARADWLNYTVDVSNSPTGPFGPTANLWTQGPLSVDLSAEVASVNIFGGKAYLPLGYLFSSLGPSEAPPPVVPPVSFAFRIQNKWIVSGQLNLLSNGEVDFANVTSSDANFPVNLIYIPRPSPAGAPQSPGWIPNLIFESDILAVVPPEQLAQTPEPATLVLAGLGVLIAGAVRRRIF